MKKNVRMLALTLVVAIALVGAGYAAWGTRITTTTALNSGEWNIVLENDSATSYWAGDLISDFKKTGERVSIEGGIDGAIGVPNEPDEDGYTDNWRKVIDTTTDDVTESGNDVIVKPDAKDYVYTIGPKPTIPGTIGEAADAKITEATFGFYNLHPGTRAYTRYEIRNNGTIPAKIGDVIVEILDGNGKAFENGVPQNVQDVIDAMVVNPVFRIHNGSTNGNDVVIDLGKKVKLTELGAELKAKLVNNDEAILNPDNTLYTYGVSSEGEVGTDAYDPDNTFNFELPGSALTGNIGMDAKFQVKISYDFVQYNEDTTIDPIN